jgi:hypothetical protein
VRIEHHHRHVRLGDGLQRVRDAGALDRVIHLGLAADAGGIDEHEVAIVAAERHHDRVARGTGHVAGNHPLFADQAVHERGLADVGSADHRHTDGARVFRRRRFGLATLEHFVDEVQTSLAVAGGNRVRLP